MASNLRSTAALSLPGQIFSGPPIDDPEILRHLPPDYAVLLGERNGFIAFDGGLHVRGACRAPDWHSIRVALEGPGAIAELFPAVGPGDVPFAQDCFGDQFLLRDGLVLLLQAETGKLASLRVDLEGFFEAARQEPEEFLGLHPLFSYRDLGGSLRPGHLLSTEALSPVGPGGMGPLRPVPMLAGLRRLAELARHPT